MAFHTFLDSFRLKKKKGGGVIQCGLFWSKTYLLRFQEIKNFMAVLRSSQNGGDPEKCCNWPRGERKDILVQDTGFRKN